ALVAAGDASAYAQQCHLLLSRNAQSQDATMLRRVSKVCLLAPLPDSDTDAAAALADLALKLTNDPKTVTQAQLGKGLAEYRLGHLRESIEWLEKTNRGDTSVFTVTANAVLAMAHHRLDEPDAAKLNLAKAVDRFNGKWLATNVNDLGDNWHDVVIAHLL